MKSFVTALIVAAGGSTRMGTRKSKLLLDLKGMPVIARTLLAFENTDCIQEIVLVCRKEEREEMLEIADFRCPQAVVGRIRRENPSAVGISRNKGRRSGDTFRHS